MSESNWIAKVDPKTNRSYYVNLKTGQSSWVVPEGVTIQDAPASNDVWLEIFDEKRGVAYYHCKALNKTTWVRPVGGTIKKVEKKKETPSESDPQADVPSGWKAVLNKKYNRYYYYCAATGETTWTRPKPADTDTNIPPEQAVIPPKTPAQPPTSMPDPIPAPILDNSSSTPVTPHPAPPVAAVPAAPMAPMAPLTPSAPQLIAAIPPELANEIHKFKLRDYAEAHFARRKKGFFFRRVVPTDEVLKFQREPLGTPLLRLPQNLIKEALTCFKVILGYMGERSGTRGDNLHLARTLIMHGLNAPGLRDEIYIQLIKQVTDNDNKQSVMRGWELILLAASCFPPAKDFENFFINFIVRHGGEEETDIDIRAFARLSLNRVKLSIQRGPRGTVPTGEEIDTVKEAPYHPIIFGVTLEEAMELQTQAQTAPGLEVPRILDVLMKSIIDADGKKTEGVFRLPGDMDEVSRLRLQLDKGDYDMPKFEVPHTPASLLKLWMRDLAEPVIPNNLYDKCLESCSSEEASLAVLNQLPLINQKVAGFVLKFLQEFAEPEVSSVTMMGIENLAMVFSPNFLRCPSQDPQVILECSRKERAFLANLITGVKAFA